jgi:hypothetical protein
MVHSVQEEGQESDSCHDSWHILKEQWSLLMDLKAGDVPPSVMKELAEPLRGYMDSILPNLREFGDEVLQEIRPGDDRFDEFHPCFQEAPGYRRPGVFDNYPWSKGLEVNRMEKGGHLEDFQDFPTTDQLMKSIADKFDLHKFHKFDLHPPYSEHWGIYVAGNPEKAMEDAKSSVENVLMKMEDLCFLVNSVPVHPWDWRKPEKVNGRLRELGQAMDRVALYHELFLWYLMVRDYPYLVGEPYFLTKGVGESI